MTQTADSISERLLHAVDETLRRTIRPALSDETARAELDFVIRAVSFVKRRQAEALPGLEQLVAGTEAQVGLSSRNYQCLLDGTKGPGGALELLEERRVVLETELSARIPALLEQAGAGDAEAAETLRDIVAGQGRFTALQDPNAAVGSMTFLGADPIEDRAPDQPETGASVEEKLARYVEQRFAAEGGKLRSVRVIPGGYSKQTVFCTIDRTGLPPIEGVIRMDLPGPAERSVVDEYPLLTLLHAHGLPVAEPYWLERDTAALGGAFMVTSRCAGKPDASALRESSEAADRFALALAALMARLHTVDTAVLEQAHGSGSAADCMRAEIGRFQALYRTGTRVPHPLLDIAYTWMLDSIPADLETQAPSLIHGDIGFHNLLLDDGLPSALLDWETAHLGDPAEELYYTKAYLEGVVDWDRFLQYYVEAGGRPLPEASRTFYEVWRGARIAANCARVRTAFEEEAPEAIGYGVLAYIFGRRLELEAAGKVVEVVAAKSA